MLDWFAFGLHSNAPQEIQPFFPYLLEQTLQMPDYGDPDLTEMANSVLELYPHYQHDPWSITESFNILVKHAQIVGKSRHLKMRILPIIQVLYFRNVFTLSNTIKTNVLDLLKTMIFDVQQEVRSLVRITLSGIIRLSTQAEIQNIMVK